jgi:hypothetical protein
MNISPPNNSNADYVETNWKVTALNEKITDPADSALIVVDCQRPWTELPNLSNEFPHLEDQIALAIQAFRTAKRPVIHVRANYNHQK